MRVLVTGAAGFLGREVMRQLMSAHIPCAGIDIQDPLCGCAEPKSFLLQRADVCDVGSWGPWVSTWDHPPTHIIHLAAYGRNLTCRDYPLQAVHVNVGGTIAVLNFAKYHNAKVLVCSSNIALSDRPTIYRATKRCAEELTQAFAADGLECMALRPSNIAGSGQSRTEYQPCAFASMDVCFEQKGFIEITGDGTQTRDFIDVRDVARAFVMSLDKIKPGAVIDICTGQQRSMIDIVSSLGVPFRLTDARPGDAKTLISDPSPAKNLIGFTAECPWQETLKNSFPVASIATCHSD